MRDHEDFRAKRQSFTMDIRRNNREEKFNKKRKMEMEQQSSVKDEEMGGKKNKRFHVIDQRFAEQIRKFHAMDLTTQNLLSLFQGLHDPDPIKKHYGIIGIRQLLCISKDPPIQAIIDTGIVPILIQHANQAQYPQLQLQATWCIANIAAGTNSQCNSVIQKGAIGILIKQLKSEYLGIVEQAIWALGNIACDSPAHRNSILKNGGLNNLISVIQISEPLVAERPEVLEIIQSASWTLSNLARSQPLVEYSQIKPALPIFYRVLAKNYIKQMDVITNICWAISHYVNKKGQIKKFDKLQNCIDSGVMSKLVQYLSLGQDTLIVACLRILGIVASGTESQTKYVISLGILNLMEPLLLRKQKKTIRREACWLISNITASSQECISTVVTNNNLISYILNMFSSDLPDIKIEICFILTNIVEFGEAQSVYMFYKSINIIKYYSDIIRDETDSSLLQSAFQTLFYILSIGQKFKQQQTEINGHNYFVYRLYQEGVVEKMESLQYHQDEKVYNEVSAIFENFFQILDPLAE